MDEKKESPANPLAPHLRVIILEKNPKDIELIVRRLEEGGYSVQFEVMDSAQSFAERLVRNVCDVILSDFNLGGWTLLDALDILKKSGKDIPLS